jgi:hypothetical protein
MVRFVACFTIVIAILIALLVVPMVSTWQASDNGQVNIREAYSTNKTEVYVKNSFFAPVTVRFDTKGTNINPSKGDSFFVVVSPQSEAFAFSVVPNDLSAKSTFIYNYWWSLGDVNAHQDTSVIYDLPFQSGFSYQVNQGFNGKF